MEQQQKGPQKSHKSTLKTVKKILKKAFIVLFMPLIQKMENYYQLVNYVSLMKKVVFSFFYEYAGICWFYGVMENFKMKLWQ